MLLGWFINGYFLGNHLFQRQGDEFYIPYDLFVHTTGLEPYGKRQQDGGFLYATHLGELKVDTSRLLQIEGQAQLSFADLKRFFVTSAEFNEAAYAIQMFIPWRPGPAPDSGQERAFGPGDIAAPTSSFSFMRTAAGGVYDLHSHEYRTDTLWETLGRTGGGVWNVMFSGDPEQKLRPSRYHWTTSGHQWALRLGTSASDPYSLLGSYAFTGLHFAWHNKAIDSYFDREQSSGSDSFLSFDLGNGRDLRGQGPPGGIAELRFDGEVAAQQRIGLDGQFLFADVPMSTSLRRTEVYLYERSILDQPLQVINFTRSIRNRSLPSGELLLRGGIGRQGNSLDEESAADNASLVGFTHALYGLTEALSVEMNWQRNPWTSKDEYLAGAVLSLGEQWATALYGARLADYLGTEAALEGHGRTWDAAWRGRWLQPDDNHRQNKEMLNHAARLSWQALDNVNLLLYGEYERQGQDTLRDFLLPGFFWQPISSTRLHVVPNSRGNYIYGADYVFPSTTRLRLEYEEDIFSSELSHSFSPMLSIRQENDYHAKSGGLVSRLYVDWNPESLPQDHLQFGAAHATGQWGFRASWNKKINTGLEWALSYSNNMGPATWLKPPNYQDLGQQSYGGIAFSGEHFIAFSFSWDLAWSGKGFLPMSRTVLNASRGAIAGRLQPTQPQLFDESTINNVPMSLNGKTIPKTNQVNGSYFVGNLKPGIYELSPEVENLPLGLTAESKPLRIQVAAGAVTEVNFPLHAEFGLMGALHRANKEAAVGTTVVITEEHSQQRYTAVSDQFGRYRIDGLRPGSYLIGVAQGEEREQQAKIIRKIIIQDHFLFDVDLIIP